MRSLNLMTDDLTHLLWWLQVDEAFDECDLHHDGKIPASELYVAILLLYHRINAMPLGGGLKKPPNRYVLLKLNSVDSL